MAKDSFEEMLKEEQRMGDMRDARNDGKRADKKLGSWVVIVYFVLAIALLIFARSDNNLGLGACIALMGVAATVHPIVKRNVMLKRCTETVTAVCIGLDEKISHSHEHGRTVLYAPKWEYSFGGRVYQHQETLHSNIGVPKIGSEYELYINPDDPDEIYRKDKKGNAFQYLFGIVFVVFGVLAMFK